MSPQAMVRRLERNRRPAGSAEERFTGFGLVGVGFESGHVLAFRRFEASTIGPPYGTVWIRDPRGRWIFHTDVHPSRSCPRYFGPALHDVRNDEIEIAWGAPDQVVIRARDARLQLALRLGRSLTTAALGLAGRTVPAGLWAKPAATAPLARAAARLLGVHALSLDGRAPAGHRYYIRPHAVWRVDAAAAVLGGRDLGAVVPLAETVRIGDFIIPSSGLLLAGSAVFIPPEAKA